MKEKGMRITCDRCGDSVFVEQHVSDYGKLEYYEEPPDGWKTVNITPLDAQATPIQLCPDCSAYLQEKLNEFWGEEKT